MSRASDSGGDASWNDFNGFEGLDGKRVKTLYGVLAGCSSGEIGDAIDRAAGTVNNYRDDLGEEGFLINLSPGRGPSEYTPGLKLVEKWTEESLNIEELEVYDERIVLETMELVRGEEYGYSHIREFLEDELSGQNTTAIIDSLNHAGLLEENKESVSGYALTAKGDKLIEKTIYNSANTRSATQSDKKGRKQSRTSRSSKGGTASDSLQELGDELLGGHVETQEQEDNVGIDSRKATNSNEVDIDQDDEAGYEGFT
jgi:predicted transcriptional regulator